MRRRDLVAIMAAVVLVPPYGVTAQDQPKKYLVGSLNTGGAIPDNSPYGAALIRGLAQHGYELDKNLAMLRRGADLHLDRLPQLVDEMVANPNAVHFTIRMAVAKSVRVIGCGARGRSG
jgi:putative ABC transport system substrate-binding protein